MARQKVKHRHYDNPRAELVAAIEKQLTDKGEISWANAVHAAKDFKLYRGDAWAEFSTLVESGRCELELDWNGFELMPLPVLVLKKPKVSPPQGTKEDFLIRLRRAQAEADTWLEELASERNRALVDVATLKTKVEELQGVISGNEKKEGIDG